MLRGTTSDRFSLWNKKYLYKANTFKTKVKRHNTKVNKWEIQQQITGGIKKKRNKTGNGRCNPAILVIYTHEWT